MKTSNLLLSSLSITEDHYNYRGTFFLSCQDISVKVDLADLQCDSKIFELKDTFKLEESCDEIRKILMQRLVEEAGISSKITEGENYEQKVYRKAFENFASYLDI
jgi:hypothetical protein